MVEELNDAAFNAKDLDKLATFYHPDVTIYEGGGVNNGWVDYRDRHLGPELKSFENLQFSHSNTKGDLLPGWSIGLRHIRVHDKGEDGRSGA